MSTKIEPFIYLSRYLRLKFYLLPLMRSHFFLIALFFALLPATSKAQLNTRDSARTAVLYSLGPAVYVPMASMANRYTPFSGVQVEALKKWQNGLLFGVAFDAFYGTSLKNAASIFDGLSNEQGNFIGVNGEWAFLNAGLSGGQLVARWGRLYPGNYNPNSGYLFLVGVGMQQSKIGIRNERGNFPQLEAPMLYGYDRLHRGPLVQILARNLHLSHNERINYSFGAVLNYALTRSVRGFNIDTGLPDTALKHDLSMGVQFIWHLPAYAKQESFYLLD